MTQGNPPTKNPNSGWCNNPDHGACYVTGDGRLVHLRLSPAPLRSTEKRRDQREADHE